jgi:protein TonB
MVHRSESELILDNILFRNRNQSYGAYEIRHAYNNHLKTAAFIAFAVFSLAVLSPKIVKLLGAGNDGITCVGPPIVIQVLQEIDLIDNPPLPPNPFVKPPQMASVAFPLFQIRDDDEVINEADVATQANLDNINPGNLTSNGEQGMDQVTHNGEGESAKTEPANMAPLVHVAEPPVFQGDYLAFLKMHTQYPNQAIDENIEGKVHVEFIVEKDGSISDLKVIKPLGYGCDEEALRVIQMTSGKWSAPKNNGIAVRFKKYLAISFLMGKNNN